MNDNDAQATRRFVIHRALVGHCGEQLTADKLDEITREIVDEIEAGGSAWAFKVAE